MKKFLMNHTVELIGGIFSLIGIGMIIGGLILGIQSSQFMNNAVQVKGIIDTIIVDEHGDEYDYDVFVSYYYDGEEYNHVHMNYYSTSMYEGEELELYVDPESPREFKLKEEDTFFKIFIPSFGGLFAVIGLPMLIIPGRKRAKNKNLIERGQHVYAEIESINLDTTVSINGRNPYRVYCSYKNPTDGYIYKFKSGCLMFNPNDSYNIGDNIDVYLDPDNFKHYYVDVVDKMADYVRDYT